MLKGDLHVCKSVMKFSFGLEIKRFFSSVVNNSVVFKRGND